MVFIPLARGFAALENKDESNRDKPARAVLLPTRSSRLDNLEE